MFKIKFTTKTVQDETPASPTQKPPTHWFIRTAAGTGVVIDYNWNDTGKQWRYIAARVEKWWGVYYATSTFDAYEAEITDARQDAVDIVGV